MKQTFRTSLFCLSATLLFSFCGNETPTITTNPTPETGQPQPLARPAGEAIFTGLYTHADERRTFQDCATGKTYWMEDATNSLGKRAFAANDPVHFDGEAAWVQVRGMLKGKSKVGHASLCDDVLAVSAVDSVTGLSEANMCLDWEFFAHGTEPFWSLMVSKATQTIEFQDIGSDFAAVFPWVEADVSGEKWLLNSTNQRDESIRILLKKEPCDDGMSERKYEYSALVVIGKKKWKGVAVRK